MRILHYDLGLPPFRSGGLTKYATDLMENQRKDGHEISLLYPGGKNPFKFNGPKIRRRKKYKNIQVYEIVNSTIIPLLHGIKNPNEILLHKKITEDKIDYFFDNVKPEIFHIHTLMGLPKELVERFKLKGVKIIYTTHDYFGLCPKVNFIDNEGKNCKNPSGLNCSICNSNAPNSYFLWLRNSKIILKCKKIISAFTRLKIILKKKNDFITNDNNIILYNELLQYFKEILNFVDFIHYNSSVSKETYEKYLGMRKSEVLSISHMQISKQPKQNKINATNIRLGFIGSLSSFKGFNILKDVLCEMYCNDIKNWTLNVWGGDNCIDIDCRSIIYRGKYKNNELEKIFNEIDLLIVPSICKETFSLVTLEALSFGTPVLISKNVGAKDIVGKYCPSFIFEPNTVELGKILGTILEKVELISEYNRKLSISEFDYTLEKHKMQLYTIYEKLLNQNNIII